MLNKMKIREAREGITRVDG